MAQPRGERLGGPRVLIVDDHRNTRDSLAIGLAALDVDVATAASADDALVSLSDRSWDWLVCDVRMPGMSGLDLATRARARWPSLGLVLMTAYDVSAEERRQISTLRADLLIKPVTADMLAARCGGRTQSEDRVPFVR